jgi:hypothetical protein
MAEVHGNRTHRPALRRTTGFEVQEAHQNLSTSVIINARNPFKSQYPSAEGKEQKTGVRSQETEAGVRYQGSGVGKKNKKATG